MSEKEKSDGAGNYQTADLSTVEIKEKTHEDGGTKKEAISIGLHVESMTDTTIDNKDVLPEASKQNALPDTEKTAEVSVESSTAANLKDTQLITTDDPIKENADLNVADTTLDEVPTVANIDENVTNSPTNAMSVDEPTENIEKPQECNAGKTEAQPASEPPDIKPIIFLDPAPSITTPHLMNTSLALLAAQYISSSDEDNDDDNASESSSAADSAENNDHDVSIVPVTDSVYRSGVVEINSESDPESDIEFVSQSQELQKIIDVADDDDDYTGSRHRGPIRVKGEMLLEDLPPIQDLHITVPEQECAEHGKIHSIVDQLVLVESLPGTVPLNLDTILFLEKGQKVLGEVFDVLGQVANPLYCVRFNSNRQIKERGIEIGQVVYIAPRTEHTHFVILPTMLKIRGSDASWENDVEPSEKYLDYSDDEEERSARRAQRNRDRGNDETDPSKRARESPAPSSSPAAGQQQPGHSWQPNRYPQHRPPRFRGAGGGNYGYPFNSQPPYQRFHSPAQYPPRFNYAAASGSWHTNYNNYVPNPYAMFNPEYQAPPYVPSDAMQQVLFPPPPPPPPSAPQ